MAKALQARLERLESHYSYRDDLPRAIFIACYGYEDDAVIGLTAHDVSLVRLPGETIEELEARAESYPPHLPGAVRCWFRKYKGLEDQA